jgi:hypothetical protein
LKQSARELEKMASLVESTVVFNESMQRCCIKPEIDENLTELNEEIERLRAKAEAIAVMLKSETGAEHLKLESNGETGFFFRVTLKVSRPTQILIFDSILVREECPKRQRDCADLYQRGGHDFYQCPASGLERRFLRLEESIR